MLRGLVTQSKLRNRASCVLLSLAGLVGWDAAAPKAAWAQGPPAAVPPAPPAAQWEELERRILYQPRKYQAADIDAFQKSGGKRLDYKTEQGKQTAWLVPQAKGATPERLWVFCGGNGMLALDWLPLCKGLPFTSDAYLLVDYPGYGECGGAPSPQTIRDNVKLSVAAAAKQVGIDPAKHPEAICVFGHSLGCAAALMAVEEFHLRSAVLCAPFTSTAEVAQAKLGLPKGFPLQHNFDNRPGLTDIGKNKGHAWIFHGDQDEVLPVDMSQTLAK